MRERIDLTEFLSEEIRNKYEFFVKSDFPTTASMSVDSLFPNLFNNKISSRAIRVTDRTFPSSSFAISEFIANTLDVRKAHVSELCKILGYSEVQIKRIMLNAKRKRLNLYLVGFGGTGTNFNYWMKELCNWTHTVNIFNKIFVTDPDRFTLSNIIRIPFDYRSRSTRNFKAYTFDNSANITSKIEVNTSATHAVAYARRTHEQIPSLDRTVFYGAPDITTRAALTEAENCKFISATHSADECQLFLNPPQDDEIQMETYGRINLSVFFMNHLKMTLHFLETLNDFDTIDWSMSGEIMEYDFKKEYLEDRTFHNDGRLYRFPCITAEELTAIEERNAQATEGITLVGTHNTEEIITEPTAPPPPMPPTPELWEPATEAEQQQMATEAAGRVAALLNDEGRDLF